jgi:hypothetical protein
MVQVFAAVIGAAATGFALMLLATLVVVALVLAGMGDAAGLFIRAIGDVVCPAMSNSCSVDLW